ncbi:hypothetical protein KIW84_021428 [Lathyrus oleraceus]|uniref:Uncharacterized protein n=1 Tax=Pisum sativum TaxID=3888 RepID=A0A9D5B5D5_PEA|nr:hypothetical protein KIW84_021428 [Pisum sativum]
MGQTHTYAIKTLVDTYTCARVLNNKSASSKWVAKAVVKRMQTSEIVRIRDIMQDIRENLFIGISVARAWKAKLIAEKIIEGDADKQYANLWRKPKLEQARAELKQKNMQKNVNVQPDVHVDVQPNVNVDLQLDVHGDVHLDASQADNKVDVDNNVVADKNVSPSQASSCVVDISQIGLS